MSFTDYTPSLAGASTGSAAASDDETGYLSLGKLKKQYTDYLTVKNQEIIEAKDSRRYRHGSQYTMQQLEALKLRRQPVVTYNRISRKIDAVIGLVEKLRQDPKAYARTPQHEQGADLATAALRYVLDEQEWKAKSPISAADGATEGIGGLELILEKGDQGDPEIGFDIVIPDTFFYDPRSYRQDFSDARFMGIGKWVDAELAKEMFPDKADQFTEAMDASEMTVNSDREAKWIASDQSRIRIIDHWYQHKGQWCYCIYTGSFKIMEGKSFLTDEKGKTFCKYIMYSANIDQDGDRYGFVRNLKSAQDEINARRSKGLHELNTRRIIAEAGAFDDIEVTRREAARPDGVVIRNPGLQAEFDDNARIANMEGQVKFLEEAKNEIENFGPNPALIGQGVENKSGRAIALLQQAGVAELGPYILAYRGWKTRVYRGLFNAIRTHWTGERWIRVTDDQGIAQFVAINKLQMTPLGPQMVNAIGSLDVDIILDEGADAITISDETNQISTQVLQTVGPLLPPNVAQALVQIMVESSQLPFDKKQIFRNAVQQAQQPNPGQQVQLAGSQAKVEETQASTVLKRAMAMKALADANKPESIPPPQQQEQQLHPAMQHLQAMADVEATHAKAAYTRAMAAKTQQDTALAPVQFAHDVVSAQADREQAAQQASAPNPIAAQPT